MPYPSEQPTHEHDKGQTPAYRVQYLAKPNGIYARRFLRNGRPGPWSLQRFSREYFDGLVARGSIHPINKEN